MAKLFISYSHRDEKALERLHKHLTMLRREGLVEDWYDREILAGANIDREVQSNLATSEVFLALVSPDFLASEYCFEREMMEALRRDEEGTIRVIPIILEPCEWKKSPLGKLRALPKDGQPISLWTNQNVAYLDIVTELRRALTVVQGASKSSPELGQAEGQGPRQRKRYRIKKEFDSIDRDEFREKAFAAIEQYFRRSVEELNQIGDPIRARFEKMSEGSFSCTVLNKGIRNQEAHITFHGHTDSHFGEITYSFSRRAPSGSANGYVRVENSEYELYLNLDQFSGSREKEQLSPDEAAEKLWENFISRAGISHD